MKGSDHDPLLRYCAREFYTERTINDDRLLYVSPNEENVFVPDAFAINHKLPIALFTEQEHAIEAARRASIRGGTLKVEEFKADPIIPIQQISWLVARFHVATPNEELIDNFQQRVKASKFCSPELAIEVCAIALAYHRANQSLVRAFAL
ncbi:hypothetical protein [Aminobacter sp. MET-1]|uniref:hypothetical protein n=1 Tax=Aminobacter sp. MET-1 TaxID=2951085 RepID=UPI002269EDFF|nr:hypothetical protein [Aminobacter sp. MET-1]MCX8571090.1 hypothetical protein [Aminobacter sp. MET-1]MCX8573241.1 hypothetical protein [Aminobacter sp. MET-1]